MEELDLFGTRLLLNALSFNTVAKEKGRKSTSPEGSMCCRATGLGIPTTNLDYCPEVSQKLYP